MSIDLRASSSRAPKTLRNGRAHKIVIDGELGDIIDRRWAARQYETTDGSTGIAEDISDRLNFSSLLGAFGVALSNNSAFHRTD
jgi:hypothetical protein